MTSRGIPGVRRSVIGVVAFAMAAGGPAAAYASLQLAPIMHAWRAKLHLMDTTLSATTPPKTDGLREAIQSYIDDATMVAGRLRGSGAQAQDFRNRFVAFAADGQKTLGDVGNPSALKADSTRIKADCASCHAVYNN